MLQLHHGQGGYDPSSFSTAVSVAERISLVRPQSRVKPDARGHAVFSMRLFHVTSDIGGVIDRADAIPVENLRPSVLRMNRSSLPAPQ